MALLTRPALDLVAERAARPLCTPLESGVLHLQPLVRPAGAIGISAPLRRLQRVESLCASSCGHRSSPSSTTLVTGRRRTASATSAARLVQARPQRLHKRTLSPSLRAIKPIAVVLDLVNPLGTSRSRGRSRRHHRRRSSRAPDVGFIPPGRAWQAGFCLGSGHFIGTLIRSAVVHRHVDIADEWNCLVYGSLQATIGLALSRVAP